MPKYRTCRKSSVYYSSSNAALHHKRIGMCIQPDIRDRQTYHTTHIYIYMPYVHMYTSYAYIQNPFTYLPTYIPAYLYLYTYLHLLTKISPPLRDWAWSSPAMWLVVCHHSSPPSPSSISHLPTSCPERNAQVRAHLATYYRN